MHRFVMFLQRHRALAAVLAAAFAILTTLLHDHAQNVVFGLQRVFQPGRWLSGVTVAFALLAAGWAVWLMARILRRPDAAVLLAYGVITLILAVAAYAMLIMVCNECIHFVQYALLAILVYPLVGRYSETVVWCALIGALDEAYQYLVLHANWRIYYDFNDVILNVVGAGIGVVALRAALPESGKSDAPARLLRRPGFVAVGLLALAATVLVGMGALGVQQSDGAGVMLALRRCDPPANFWLTSEFGKGYHEVMPLEGVLAIAALLAFYTGLDVLRPAWRGCPANDAVDSPVVKTAAERGA